MKLIVEGALKDLEGTLTAEQIEKVTEVIRASVVRGLLEGQHQAVDVCHNVSEAEQDLAHKIATEIRLKNDALIVNLSAMY
jgi:hypothetical protein